MMKGALENWVDSLKLKEDDVILFATNLAGMAKVMKAKGETFSVDVFIETFQRALPQGTIIVPAYTDNLKCGDVFDPKTSKPTTGAISNKVQRRKDFKRTSDPLHSVFVWGAKTNEILALEDESTFGKQSIFGFLHKVNAKMIIIDEHLQNSFTFIHYVEEQMKVKYRRYYNYNIKVVEDGKVVKNKVLFYTKRRGVENDLYDLQVTLRANKTVTLSYFDTIEIQLLNFKEAYNSIQNYLLSGKRIYYFSILTWVKSVAKTILRRK
ncbi:MAG: AAC(3) family N-acetyltransferase [Crocinitomicaceae bacterium]|nr:AAC(3) family N-acetyltransferase [Crocinitomicaceae bacterium]